MRRNDCNVKIDLGGDGRWRKMENCPSLRLESRFRAPSFTFMFSSSHFTSTTSYHFIHLSTPSLLLPFKTPRYFFSFVHYLCLATGVENTFKEATFLQRIHAQSRCPATTFTSLYFALPSSRSSELRAFILLSLQFSTQLQT